MLCLKNLYMFLTLPFILIGASGLVLEIIFLSIILMLSNKYDANLINWILPHLDIDGKLFYDFVFKVYEVLLKYLKIKELSNGIPSNFLTNYLFYSPSGVTLCLFFKHLSNVVDLSSFYVDKQMIDFFNLFSGLECPSGYEHIDNVIRDIVKSFNDEQLTNIFNKFNEIIMKNQTSPDVVSSSPVALPVIATISYTHCFYSFINFVIGGTLVIGGGAVLLSTALGSKIALTTVKTVGAAAANTAITAIETFISG